MAEQFGSDSFFRRLLEMRENSRDEMALALMQQVGRVCRTIARRYPKYGFYDATETDLECYADAATIAVLTRIDGYLDDPRNHPDYAGDDAFGPFQRQRWLINQTVTAMRAERRRLYERIPTVSINSPLSEDDDEEELSSRIASRGPTPEELLVKIDLLSERFRQIVTSSCSTDTVICVLYSILATEADRQCTYDDCEEHLKGKTRGEICRMILETFSSLSLEREIGDAVAGNLADMLEERLKKEDPDAAIWEITSDRIRKSKNRLFKLIDRK